MLWVTIFNFLRGLVDACVKVALFLLCMPILAAPLQSLGVIGTRDVSPSPAITRRLTPLLGFVLLGIPVYYITQKNEDTPRVFGEHRNQLERIYVDEGYFSAAGKLLWSIKKQTGCWFWMAGRRDRRSRDPISPMR